MSDILSVIGKVQALLALAASSTSEGECANARAAADALIQEHRISAAQLEVSGDKASEPFVTRVIEKGGKRSTWREFLLQALCEHNGGAWIFSSFRTNKGGGVRGTLGSKGASSYAVCAKVSDLAIIWYMYDYITRECERLCRWHTGGKGVGAASAWRVGFAMGIRSQLSDLRAKRHVSDREHLAIVLLGSRSNDAKAFVLASPNTREVRINHTTPSNTSAMAEGYAEGKKAQIRSALPAGENVPMLPGC